MLSLNIFVHHVKSFLDNFVFQIFSPVSSSGELGTEAVLLMAALSQLKSAIPGKEENWAVISCSPKWGTQFCGMPPGVGLPW